MMKRGGCIAPCGGGPPLPRSGPIAAVIGAHGGERGCGAAAGCGAQGATSTLDQCAARAGLSACSTA